MIDQMLNRIEKAAYESASGKIERTKSVAEWVSQQDIPADVFARFSDKRSVIDYKEGLNDVYRRTSDGRYFVLIPAKTSVLCHNPELWEDRPFESHANGAKAKAYVSTNQCRKCPHYVAKANSPEKYAICALSRKKNLGDYSSPSEAANSEVSALIIDALGKASETMKKSGVFSN
ncbi:MAG: hypothetical protein AAF327_21980 [Cyanobacteria bacterium P01_A01_bin.37]